MLSWRSSVGRVSEWHSEGREFESHRLHHKEVAEATLYFYN